MKREDTRLRQLIEEGLEWCRDFRDGQFTPAPTRDGWTVEMHGLVDSHEQVCRYAEQAEAQLTAQAERLRELREAAQAVVDERKDTKGRIATAHGSTLYRLILALSTPEAEEKPA